MSECMHIWVADDPEFRVNRQMSPEPLIYVRCERCNARTWFTKEQWSEIPEDDSPDA